VAKKLLIAVVLVQNVPDVLHNELDGDRVLATPGNNHVSVFHSWKTEFLKSRLDESGH
jgi:hypothetical protein